MPNKNNRYAVLVKPGACTVWHKILTENIDEFDEFPAIRQYFPYQNFPYQNFPFS